MGICNCPLLGAAPVGRRQAVVLHPCSAEQTQFGVRVSPELEELLVVLETGSPVTGEGVCARKPEVSQRVERRKRIDAAAVANDSEFDCGPRSGPGGPLRLAARGGGGG